MPITSVLSITTRENTVTRQVPYPHPGEILREEFLLPLGITKYRLAKAIGVPAPRIGEIIAERRSITADTGLRLSRFLGTSDDFWSGLQADYDREVLRERMADELAAIIPWSELSRTLPVRKSPASAGGTAKRRPKV